MFTITALCGRSLPGTHSRHLINTYPHGRPSLPRNQVRLQQTDVPLSWVVPHQFLGVSQQLSRGYRMHHNLGEDLVGAQQRHRGTDDATGPSVLSAVGVLESFWTQLEV